LAVNDDAMTSILSCSLTNDKRAPPRTEEIVPLPPTPSVAPFSSHLHPSRDAPSRALRR
jgi:hypothetical protein